jgi:hypothetical protein
MAFVAGIFWLAIPSAPEVTEAGVNAVISNQQARLP